MTTSSAEVLPVAGRPDHGAAGARLSALFAGHGAAVLGLCRVLMRNPEEAEDAVQQTFLAAYRSLLNGTEPRHPAAWLATIARNECWGRIEQRMREPLAEHELASTLPDPVVAAAEKADLSELWRAIGELPRQQRSALLLREFSGLSYVELAAALGVTEPAVESLLFRARRELRMRLRTVYGSVGSVAPLVAIREALSRSIGGMPDPATTGVLAKVAAAPLMAKVVAGAAGVVVAGGTVAAVESHSTRHRAPVRDVQAAAVHPAAVAPTARATAAKSTFAPRTRPTQRSAVPVRAASRPAVTQASTAAAATAVRPEPTNAAPAPTTTSSDEPADSASTPATAPPSGDDGAPTRGGATAGDGNEPDATTSTTPTTSTAAPDAQGEDEGSTSSSDASGDDNTDSSGEDDTSGSQGDETAPSGEGSGQDDDQGSGSGSGSGSGGGSGGISGDGQDGGTGGHGKG